CDTVGWPARDHRLAVQEVGPDVPGQPVGPRLQDVPEELAQAADLRPDRDRRDRLAVELDGEVVLADPVGMEREDHEDLAVARRRLEPARPEDDRDAVAPERLQAE